MQQEDDNSQIMQLEENSPRNGKQQDLSDSLRRKMSTQSIFSHLNSLQTPHQEKDTDSRQDFFFKKILPGLDAFAFMEPEGAFPDELNLVDSSLFTDKDEDGLFGTKGFENLFEKNDDQYLFSVASKKASDKNISDEIKKSSIAYAKKSAEQLFSKKMTESLSSIQFPKRLENFIFVELQGSENTEGPFSKIKKDYYDMLYKLKSMLLGNTKVSNMLKVMIDFSVSGLRTLLKEIKTYDERKMSNCLMRMASMDRRIIDIKENEKQISENFSHTLSSTVKNTLSFDTKSDSNSKNRKRKKWSRKEEKDLMSLIVEFWPGNIEKSKIIEFSNKWKRTQASVKSKIQKIRKRYQNSMESELDNMLLSRTKSSSRLSATNSTKSSEMEKKVILEKVLKKHACNGLTKPQVRKHVPEQIIGDHQILKFFKILQNEGKIDIKNEMIVDLRKVITNDNNLIQHLKIFKTIGDNRQDAEEERRYIFRLSEIFSEGVDQNMKKKFMSEQFRCITCDDYFYWKATLG